MMDWEGSPTPSASVGRDVSSRVVNRTGQNRIRQDAMTNKYDRTKTKQYNAGYDE